MGKLRPPSPEKSQHLKSPGHSPRVRRNSGRTKRSFIILPKNCGSDNELDQESKSALCKPDSLSGIPEETPNFQPSIAEETPHFPEPRQLKLAFQGSQFELDPPEKLIAPSQPVNHFRELLRGMRKKSDSIERDLPDIIPIPSPQGSVKKPVISIGGSSFNDNPFRPNPVNKSFGNLLAIDNTQTAKFNAESREIIGSHEFDDKIMQREKNLNNTNEKIIKRRLTEGIDTLDVDTAM